MKDKIHPKYVDAEIRCACGNIVKTRSTKPVIIVGICNACHPFYTGQQKFVVTPGGVGKFSQPWGKISKAPVKEAVDYGGHFKSCHPFYTGQQKFVDTAGRVDKFQQRMVKTQAAQAAAASRKKKIGRAHV